MTVLLILLAVVGLVASVGAVDAVRRDGYGPVPTRRS